MKKIIMLVLFFLCCFTVVWAQKTLDDMELYTSSRDLINGPRWAGQSFLYDGHPFFGSGKWVVGTVWFNGRVYGNIRFNYDLSTDEVIIYDDQNLGEYPYYVLNKDKLERFMYVDPDTGKAYDFRKGDQLGLKGEAQKKSLYNLVYHNSLLFLIRFEKIVKNNYSNGKPGEYYEKQTMLLVQDGNVNRFSSKKSLLNLLQDKEEELKKYIRSAKLKIKKSETDHVVMLLKQYEQLNAQ